MKNLLLCLPLILALIDANDDYEESKWPKATQGTPFPESVISLALDQM